MSSSDRFNRLACLSLATVSLAVIPLKAATDNNSNEPKDYTLFVGVDLAIQANGKYLPVVGTRADSFQVQSGKMVTDVAAKDATDLRVTRGVKLSSLSATVDSFQFGKAKDMSLNEWDQKSTATMAMQARGQATLDKAVLIIAQSASVSGGGDPGQAHNPSAANGSFHSPTGLSSHPATSAGAADTGYFRDEQRGSEITKDLASSLSGVDTIEFSCVVSSAHPLNDAYLVVVTDFRQPDSSSDAIAHRVTTRQIGTVDEKRRVVSFGVEGFPANVEIVAAHVSLYANGQEVATNLSEKQVGLTRDEARDYIFVEYLTSHKGETRPPALMAMKTKAEIRAGIDVSVLPQVVYATIGKQGQVRSVTMDESGRNVAPDSVQSFIANYNFVPALNKGQPVEGRLTLKPADLVR